MKQNVLRDLELNIRLNKTLRALNRRKAMRVIKAFKTNVVLKQDVRQYDNLLEKKCNEFIISKFFCKLKANYLETLYAKEQARKHQRQTYLLKYMKILWVNTTGLKKMKLKRAYQFRLRKLQGKVLACLFVNKCKT